MQDDDDQWLAGLAGKTPAAAGDDLSAQGAALRSAILARTVSEPGAVPAIDSQREAALIWRARAAGLLGPTRSRTVWWATLAAALACVALGVSLQMRPQTATVVLRGDSAGPLRIRAADPLRLKQELLRELSAAGVQATGYDNLGLQGIDADLPRPLPEAVRRILDRHAIPLPSGNVLQLEIEPDKTL
jgi:hypothetical protein